MIFRRIYLKGISLTGLLISSNFRITDRIAMEVEISGLYLRHYLGLQTFP
jgi:hypothetical protein